jgi:hypothetical protein
MEHGKSIDPGKANYNREKKTEAGNSPEVKQNRYAATGFVNVRFSAANIAAEPLVYGTTVVLERRG